MQLQLSCSSCCPSASAMYHVPYTVLSTVAAPGTRCAAAPTLVHQTPIASGECSTWLPTRPNMFACMWRCCILVLLGTWAPKQGNCQEHMAVPTSGNTTLGSGPIEAAAGMQAASAASSGRAACGAAEHSAAARNLKWPDAHICHSCMHTDLL